MSEKQSIMPSVSKTGERLGLNPLSPPFLENPYPFYHELRATSPVHWVSSVQPEGWFITGYKEVAAILKDARFEKRMRIPQISQAYEPLVQIQKNMMLFQNPPDHTRLRTLTNKALSPFVTRSLQPYIEETAQELLAQVKETGKMDLISDFAFPLPVLVIAKLLGVPAEDRTQFREWASVMVRTIDLSRTATTLSAGGEMAYKLIDYFHCLFTQRRKHPQDDVISALLAAREQEDKMNEEELVATCILLLVAGHETTVNLVGNGMLALLRHPDQLHKLREAPTLISTAVEEFLRYESPTQMTVRFAAEDVEIGDVLIRKDEQMYIVLGAANRDPSVFPKPDQLDITRNPNPHLAFGAGIHFCLGALLARMEARIAINTLLHQLPYLHLESVTPQWRDLVGFRGLQSLPISFME